MAFWPLNQLLHNITAGSERCTCWNMDHVAAFASIAPPQPASAASGCRSYLGARARESRDLQPCAVRQRQSEHVQSPSCNCVLRIPVAQGVALPVVGPHESFELQRGAQTLTGTHCNTARRRNTWSNVRASGRSRRNKRARGALLQQVRCAWHVTLIAWNAA
jgi:hypothetical protein